MSMTIGPPLSDEYPDWAVAEIEGAHHPDLLTGLKASYRESMAVLETLSGDVLSYVYEPGKWTIREIWQHVIDVERILSYRALRFARGDETVLSGFSGTNYTTASLANHREWTALLQEYRAVRASTIALFASFDEKMVLRRGTTGRSAMSVRALGYLCLGHDIHHLRVVRERYLASFPIESRAE